MNGVGPSDGQLAAFDLTRRDPDLRGFWDGFSSVIGGVTYAYLVPYYNGQGYSGKAVQIQVS